MKFMLYALPLNEILSYFIFIVYNLSGSHISPESPNLYQYINQLLSQMELEKINDVFKIIKLEFKIKIYF